MPVDLTTDDPVIAPRSLYVPEPRPDAPFIVYGIGHSGAGAAPWRTVAAQLGADAELRAHRLPGRENRLAEAAFWAVESAAAELAAAILAAVREDERPFLVAGVCAGAVIGRVALDLVACQGPSTVVDRALGLVVCDQTAPTTPAIPLSGLPTAELRAWLRDHGGTPQQLLDDERVFGFLEPVLRADLAMVESYEHGLEPLGLPLYLVRMAARTDEDIDLERWREDAGAAFHVIEAPFAGNALTEYPDELAQVLRDAWALGADSSAAGR